MIKEAISHRGVTPDLYLSEKNILHIGIQTARGDIQNCELVYFTRTTPARRIYQKMYCRLRDDQRDYYETEIVFPKTARYTKYYFSLTDYKDETIYVTAHGLLREEPKGGYFDYTYANKKECIRIPEWSKGLIYYQIFPERFCNGNKENDPIGCVSWGSKPTRENYMGGDLAGIYEKLPYLEKLGVECLYLTPVFKADFNHKYATVDYFSIDPSFGEEEDLIRVVNGCHERGIRIILDGVFNHCGIHFPPFEDLLDKQEKSKYWDWFLITKVPVTVSNECYECMGAYEGMPKLNNSNPEVRKFVISVMRYWIKKAGIDGWRLDVADEIDSSLWMQARIELKEEFPDCLLMGETWGSGYRMMMGNQMDTIMDYGIRDAVEDYLMAECPNANDFDQRIGSVFSYYPRPMIDGLYHMLDSHDTPRFFTVCQNDFRKMKLAVALQFLLPGAPAIYYGDEVGMKGENDPDCRRCFPWEESLDKTDIYEWYSRLIRLRKREKSLRTGDYGVNFSEGGTFGFYRRQDKDILYVICNADMKKEISVPVLEMSKCRIILSETTDEKSEISQPYVAEEGAKNSDITEYVGMVSVNMPEWSVIVMKQEKSEE